MKKFLKIECGRTRSGKPIFEHPISEPGSGIHEAHRDFGAQEHFDAFAVFAFLENRSGLRLGLDDRWAVHYGEQAAMHLQLLDRLRLFEQLKEEAGIITIVDLRFYARKLVHPAFRD